MLARCCETRASLSWSASRREPVSANARSTHRICAQGFNFHHVARAQGFENRLDALSKLTLVARGSGLRTTCPICCGGRRVPTRAVLASLLKHEDGTAHPAESITH